MISKIDEKDLELIRGVKIHRLLGLSDNGREQRIPCPIHAGKNNNFSLSSDNKFHCFKCGASGSGSIDFCVALGFSFNEALEEIIKYV